ncbi:unnamed protein product [Lymnaea stagnalis]|uniref:BPTI/Kunitz inhibitor domain-containing protein n=1 Tax=Lymnaea stagnalis TaxID=6523 RepID=A0AAV2H1B5_LYMST
MMTKMLVFCLFGMLCIRLSTQKTAICELQPDAGTCKGLFDRYFFNKVRGECEYFAYGGCNGNANNFKSSELCLTTCGPAVKKYRHTSFGK